ncbi:ataxin-7-like protein 1 isoform X2 [Bombus vosnesenskii]|uniref:Ataxin-7-like protein 1 isoform X2 n=1 Tax=Bombus vosnesenskii TaxID=207650 RepID=A0A6J3KGN3_9HYME|nr:ataxin-7-like protein 1 isoform X2 [Bombus vosnesenskii]XP_050479603.1 ataxin-7-like protein 1 isoform X2 [Bombus huntii]
MSGSDSPTFFHGQPWSSWIEKIGRDKPLSDEEPDAQLTSSVTRLSAEDIDLYGFCPERDAFYTVVCETCHAIVKPQALIQHMESRHPSGTVNFPPPSTPVVKTPLKTPYCKVSKLKKTQSSPQISNSGSNKINHTNVKRNTEQPSISTNLSSSSIPISSSPRSPLESLPSSVQTSNSGSGTVISSSPVKSPGTATGQPRRKRLKTDRSLLKDREYDPDRHCGVWNEETGKPCTRSLTCKAHTVSLRRTVIGRSKTFDKLLAEHRASKEVPNRPTKVTVTGTVTVSSGTSNLNPLTPTNPALTIEAETPSSPPVLSLPDTYPLPKTKLEEDFVNEELRSLESSLVNSTGSTQSSSMMAPISVVLPSLSPLPANNEESTSSVATLIPSTASPAIPVPASLPATCTQPPLVTTVLEAETPMDIDPEAAMTIYSPVYQDKSKLLVEIPRSNNIVHSPISSMPSLLFESMDQLEQLEQLEQQHATQINGKRLNHTTHSSPVTQLQSKRTKHEYHQQDLSTAIQVEATTTSSPYPHFGDISWSNCHPEPLAVSRWLRISSSRKQYNFNIH